MVFATLILIIPLNPQGEGFWTISTNNHIEKKKENKIDILILLVTYITNNPLNELQDQLK